MMMMIPELDCSTGMQCCRDCPELAKVVGSPKVPQPLIEELDPRQADALRRLSVVTNVPEIEYIRQGVAMMLEAIAARELKTQQFCKGCSQYRGGWPEKWGNVPTRKGGLRYCCAQCVAEHEANNVEQTKDP
jgi:hypothetical protein